MPLLFEAAMFLAAAVLVVPLLSRAGLGSVLGYLAAGIAIGPDVLGFVSDYENILRFSEFGVVLLLFLIGLELQPSRLFGLRRPIFGLGGAQVGLTGLVLAGIGLALGLGPGTALVTGFIMALSSTALVAQLLAEKGQLRSRAGRAAFSILLFQDMAVIPLLALMPVLALQAPAGGLADGPERFLFAAAAIAAVVMAGHFLLPYFLRQVVATRIAELFTVSALFVVVGTAALMEFAGLSMALGAFLAGVMLSDSEYRHALVADIEPFKGLLMGLFFIAVGMSADLDLILARPGEVLGLAAGLLAVKWVCLYALALAARLPRPVALRVAFALPQGGEFAFVLFTAAVANGVVERSLADLMILVVTLTMIATPLLHMLGEKLAGPVRRDAPRPAYDRIEADEARVIIAGFGRVGQIVGRVLRSEGVPFIAVDYDFERIRVVRRFGIEIHYGDLTRLWILRAAGADRADILICAMDDVDGSIALVDLARKHFPHMKIYARARDRDHAFHFIEHGVDRAVRETLGAGLEIAAHALQGLGVGAAESHAAVERFRVRDEALLHRQAAEREDPDRLVPTTREAAAELEQLFEDDRPRAEPGAGSGGAGGG